MPDIVIAEPMNEAAVRDLGRSFDVRYDYRLAGNPNALTGAIADARALIVGDCTVIDADLLEAAPRLQVIGCLGGQSGLVDEDACRARGIEVYSPPNGGEAGIADRVAAAVVRLLDQSGQAVNGDERRLGLIGFGPVARMVAERARAQGLRVAAFDPTVDADDPALVELGVELMSLHRLLAISDAISLHIRLTEETRNLIDWETISEMRRGAVLVNASRAGLVDHGAVSAAMRRGLIGGALLELGDLDDEPGPENRWLNPASASNQIARKVRAALEARPGI